MTRIMIIGGGAGGTSLIPILHEYNEIEITGVIDINPQAPGIVLAKKMSIATSHSFTELYKESPCEIIINVTNDENTSLALRKFRNEQSIEVIEGASAKVIFKLVDERRIREEESLLRLNELEALYQIGIMLTSSESENDLLNSILEYSTKLTSTPAGSIALYNDRNNSMELVLSCGFDLNVSEKTTWQIRKGGLTEYILNKGSPLIINDVDKFDKVVRAEIKKIDIKSLIAVPLIVERRSIGILYVDDFTPRQFTKNEISVLSLLATQAAIAIERMQRFERNRMLAITDGLTGLYNHRYFCKSLKREIKRAKRNSHQLSVIIVDIDHFKHFNDTNGHLQGNEALKGVASVLQLALRKIDILSRYGGEEFAVILPETDKKQALQIANRICSMIRNQTIAGMENQPKKRLTLSAGVATFPEDAKLDDCLTNRADKALYVAKEQGRDRAVPYTGA
ncbi:MAG: sensor domain-containing diguanylate cyclase [Candidatus Polarisedimenticolaceae bacterium]|nr:sensor domain-containing diguanylate cyclase [Candidatus Polarisedimenticolaceae bacterium]